MIQARQFIDAARELGFRRYCGVPCSFLTPLINQVIDDPGLGYVSSANEGDALATAAGAWIGGQGSVVMIQNSGLGNAVSPLTSLTWVFRIPVLLIVTHRGQPGLKDEPQHELMGRITPALLETMEIPWEVFPRSSGEIEACLGRAADHMHARRRPYALVMHKGSVAGDGTAAAAPPARGPTRVEARRLPGDALRVTRRAALQRIIDATPEDGHVLIASTGYAGRELYAAADRANHLYMVGSMGCAASLGLGLALARPNLKVVILDGDGAALMRMGNFATLGSYAGGNLVHILLDNERHESTGGQATVSANVRFARIAAACGYGLCQEGDDPRMIEALLEADAPGPRFAHLKIRPGTGEDLPRPDTAPADVLRRLMRHID